MALKWYMVHHRDHKVSKQSSKRLLGDGFPIDFDFSFSHTCLVQHNLRPAQKQAQKQPVGGGSESPSGDWKGKGGEQGGHGHRVPTPVRVWSMLGSSHWVLVLCL